MGEGFSNSIGIVAGYLFQPTVNITLIGIVAGYLFQPTVNITLIGIVAGYLFQPTVNITLIGIVAGYLFQPTVNITLMLSSFFHSVHCQCGGLHRKRHHRQCSSHAVHLIHDLMTNQENMQALTTCDISTRTTRSFDS